ncbi:MAG TPA: NUDIX hydrolase [Rhizomicrobium sp.]|nr:NUDIX hydrolase [Rhizomicrobium sp.]
MAKKTVVESRTLLLDDFLKVEAATLSHERFDGTMSEAVRRLDVVRNDAVAALVVNKARGSVVLVRQFRYATLSRGEGWLTETVAGLVDEGEVPEDAVRREILEETGYEAGVLEPVFTFYPTPGITSERIVLFCAETRASKPAGKGGGVADEHEDIEVIELSFADAFARLDRGEFADGKTIIALQWLRERLRAPVNAPRPR